MLLANVILLLLAIATSGKELKFPYGFKFGVATASYQVEGGWNASGKGENIWDHLTHNHPSWVKGDTNGDVACDSYHKYREDVSAIKDIGADFYRFSLSWSRLLPTGIAGHPINPDGVNYYNGLINELVAKNIEPVVTLYHWDLPQPLQDIGGWTNEILAVYFRDYANMAFRLFGDRVKTWITFNEPIEVCESGYGEGNNAPALRLSGVADYMCGKTLLIAHAKAYRLYDRVYKKKFQGKVGITINSIWSEPKTNSTEDQEAAERYMQMNYGWWTHPILSETGDYPEIMKTRIANLSSLEGYRKSRLPKFTKKQVAMIRSSYDFLGLNHYSTWLVSNDERPVSDPASHEKDIGVRLEQDPNWKSSSLPWLKVVPWGFRKLLNWIKDEFGNPTVYVTENGFADVGEMNDTDRIQYHKEYLQALLEAIHLDDCRVKSYTAWSLMDNMEWREGYTAKFGLYHVDFNDPKRTRTAKSSAQYYKKLIETRKV